MKRFLVPVVSATLLLHGERALAFDYVEIGFGLLGNFGANFIDQPSDQLVEGREVKPEYPGFAGATVGIGPMIDFRFFEYVGVELDFLYQSDKGTTDITITNLTTGQETIFEIKMGHSAWHIPLLFKGAFLPDQPVQPVVGIGPEFVIPVGNAKLGEQFEIIGENTTTTQYGAIEATSYTRLAIALGIEARLPIDSPYISLRIPFTVRGSFHTGLDDTRSAREDTVLVSGTDQPASIKYRNEWEYQVSANFGMSLHF